MKPAPFDYVASRDSAHALALLGDSDGMGKLCSGTMSLGPMLNLRLAQPTRLIDVSRLDALLACERRGDVLRLGAAVTHARIEDALVPDVTHGLLASVAGGIAYRAVRNRGTLGGSLAHADPCADWVTTMCLLDASMILVGRTGQRVVQASDFFLGPFTTALAEDELLAAIDVPCFGPQGRWAYRKTCRKPGEFAEAIAAVWVDPSQGIARVALGALDGMPQVIGGPDAVKALRTQAGVNAALDAAGVQDAYERQLQSVMIGRALADIDSFPSQL